MDIPSHAEILAESEACKIQALAVGSNAFSLQYHVELTQETIAEWGSVPVYVNALEATFGECGLQKLDSDARQIMPSLNQTARQLYRNAMGIWSEDSGF